MNKKPLDVFHYHEAMDRIEMLGTILDETVLAHPVVEAETHIRMLLEDASSCLNEAYKLAAILRFEKSGDES